MSMICSYYRQLQVLEYCTSQQTFCTCRPAIGLLLFFFLALFRRLSSLKEFECIVKTLGYYVLFISRWVLQHVHIIIDYKGTNALLPLPYTGEYK